MDHKQIEAQIQDFETINSLHRQHLQTILARDNLRLNEIVAKNGECVLTAISLSIQSQFNETFTVQQLRERIASIMHPSTISGMMYSELHGGGFENYRYITQKYCF